MSDQESAAGAEERHASWLELFFDLVAVAGIGQLAHLLHGTPSLPDIGLYVLLYLAFWTTWATFTVYGNIAGDRAGVRVMLTAMFGIAVMVAAVSGVHAEHAEAFAVAYIFVRFLSGRLWQPGQVILDWPLVQMGAGLVPWIVSLWIDPPAKYWLWAGGIALDLFALLWASGDRMLRATQERVDRVLAKQDKIPDRHGRPVPTVEAVRLDTGHLAERLGLYVIIVLGEGVIQLVTAASEVPWDGPLIITVIAGFLLLVGLWTLSVRYGFAGIPHLYPGVVPGRIAMILHCTTTAALATTAAGLGAAATHPDHHLPTSTAWLLAGSTATYFAIIATVGIFTRAPKKWLLTAPIPGAIAAALIGLAAPALPTPAVAALLLVPTAWQVRQLTPRQSNPKTKTPPAQP